MAVLVSPIAVSLRPGLNRFATPEIALASLTDMVEVRLRRPTTLTPLSWDVTSQIEVRIHVVLDGVVHTCTGRVRGGIRLDRFGDEVPEYVLRFMPTYGYFGARIGTTKRLGERATTSYTARLELIRLVGSAATQIEASVTESPAPLVPFTSSVAFDAATDAQELSGDGVLSLTHTSTGSNLAAFAGISSSLGGGARTSTSTTFAGTGMTEMWDGLLPDTNFMHAGYRIAGQTSGAQTVTNTLSGITDEHILGVISMTGVDQTTPVGTAATATGTTGNPSVTVTSVGADDLVVDNCYNNLYSGGGTVTVGADQTERYRESIGGANGVLGVGSTQPGTAGGVMSWTRTGNDDWGIGAVAFKPAAGAAAATFSSRIAGGFVLN